MHPIDEEFQLMVHDQFPESALPQHTLSYKIGRGIAFAFLLFMIVGAAFISIVIALVVVKLTFMGLDWGTDY